MSFYNYLGELHTCSAGLTSRLVKLEPKAANFLCYFMVVSKKKKKTIKKRI